MSTERHTLIQDLFEAAAELAGAERDAFLAARCAGDDELRRQVERLLALDESSLPGALDVPAPARLGAAGMLDALGGAEAAALPERIGEYRVLRELGRGGMGVVYEAEQDQPRRRVALKMLRPWLIEPSHLRRFEHEAQVLGWLSHPGIAHVYAAGTADTGAGPQPYFAMELVDGSPLTAFATERGLDVRARLELLARVCDAVHHAHQKGVVHRDLKPANVLVDGSGQPKVLDFGVARVTDTDLRPETLETRAGDILGTLSYMSPEQLAGDPSAVDTRADVYALGVIGYELLTGSLPLPVAQLPIAEAARRIQSDEPTSPSALRRELRGDPETILLKALEKDPARRYASAEELASDIRRALSDEPIVARPPSAAYQLRKFARRNRGLVAGAVGVVVALAIGLAVSTTLYFESEDRGDRLAVALENEVDAREEAQAARDAARAAERDAEERRAALAVEKARAEDALAELRETQTYFDAIFASSMPYEEGAQVLVVDVLERMAAGVDAAFADRPLARARLLQRVGRTLQGIGLAADSLVHLERAEALYAAHDDVPPVTFVELEDDLGVARAAVADWEGSLAHHRRGLELVRALEPPAPALEFGLRRGVVTALLGARRLDEGRAEVEAALDAIATRASGDLSSRGAFRLSAAQIALEQGRLADADELGRAALADLEGGAEPDRYQVLGALRLLAGVALQEGRTEDALDFQERSYAGMVALLGRDHMDLVMALQGLATVYQYVPDLERSGERYREALAMCARLIESPSEPHGFIRAQYGQVLAQQGLHDAAEAEFAGAVDELRAVLDPDHYLMGLALAWQGQLYAVAGRPTAAIEALEEALTVLRRNLPPEHDRILSTLSYLAQAHEDDRDAAAALARYVEGADLQARRADGPEVDNLRWRFGVARGLLATGQAERARAEFEALWPRAEALEASPDRASFTVDYGAFLASAGEVQAGAALIREGLDALPADGSFAAVERRAERHLRALEAGDASER